MNIRTLVLCDDLWHPGAIARRGLKALGDCGFDFEFLKNNADWPVLDWRKFQLVVLAKSNVVSAKKKRAWLTKDSEKVFCDHIRRGTGLVVIHSGTADYAELPVMRGVIGGAFLRHPPQCPVTIEPKPRRPLTKSVTPFMVQDEHYFMKLDDARAKIFLQSRSEHGVQPAGWTRIEGKGRVCVLTPGHNVEVWLHPMFQTLLLNALRWAAKID
ncbi:MAG TPA: ThuA domain-containing protein [Verrucomicrobiae bacterium]|jgi:type 1 glutamine amidotransferase